jgi:RHS repeat-associated protein
MTPKTLRKSRRLRLSPLLFFLLAMSAIAGVARAAAQRVQITGVINGTGRIELASGGAAADAQGNIKGEASLNAGTVYQLTLHATCTEATVILLPPEKHTVFIDGVETRRIQVQDMDGMVPSVHDVSLRYTEKIETPGAVTRSSLSNGDFTWGVSLGRAYNGSSAGSLAVTRVALEQGAFDRGVLHYHGVDGQTSVIRDLSTGYVRQVLAPEALVDIEDLTPDASGRPGFRIAFYPISALVQSGTLPYPVAVGAASFVSYEIRPPQTAGDPLEITDPVKLTSLTGDSKLIVGVELDSEVVDETHDTGVNADGDSVETVTLRDGDGVVALQTQKTYRTFEWNSEYGYPDPHELIEEVRNPQAGQTVDNKVVPGRALKTTYEYYSGSGFYSGDGQYGRLKKVTSPDGNWVEYAYFTDSGTDYQKAGRLKTETRPWLSGPATRVIEYDYDSDWDGAYTLVKSRTETIGATEVSKLTATRTLNQNANDLKYYTYTETLHGSGTGASAETLVTTTKRYQPVAVYTDNYANRAVFNNLPYSVEQPGGAKVSYAYQRGNIVSGDFVPCTGFGQSATAMKEISLVGLGHSVTGAVQSTSIDGITIDTIHLVPNRSVKTVAIRQNGRVIREESHVFTGGAGFEPLAWTTYTYTASGQLAGRTGSAGAEYSATWTNGFRSAVTTETGEHYEYSPDLFNRMKSVQRADAPGAGGHAAQSAVLTEFTHDAAGRVTRQTTTGGGLRMADTTVYDWAGRVVSHTGVNGYTSTTTDAIDGDGFLVTTVNAACGGTSIVAKHPDGRVKSVTGDAGVARYYTYEFDSDGGMITTTHYGAENSGAWERVLTDRLGRTIKKITPLPDENAVDAQNYTDDQVAIVHYYYEPDTTRLIKTTQPGSAPILYEYDALGTPGASGLDVDGDGALTAGSIDRRTESSVGYHKIGADWWWRQTSTVYTENNTAAKSATTETLTRLTGFSGNLRSETRATDAYGNTTVSTVQVNRAGRLVTETTTLPGAAGAASRVLYNGKLSSVTSALGETVRHAYDALGRLRLTTPHRTRAVETLYLSGTDENGTLARSQVYQTQYADAGPLIARYGYDSGGRVDHVTDAAGAEIFREYSCRGELTAEWGTGTQPVTYSYDEYGRLRTQKTYRGIEDGAQPDDGDTGDPTTFSYYNDTGWLLSRGDAASPSHATVYTYDEAGRLETQTNARGRTVSLAYDPATEELLTKTWGAPLPGEPNRTESIAYTYTRAGALASITDPATGERTFAYDGTLGLALERETLPAFYGGRTLDYLYQSGTAAGVLPGRLESYSLVLPGDAAANPTGDPVTELSAGFAFNASGQIASISASPGEPAGAAARLFEYSYLAASPGLVSGVDEMSVGYHREQTWEDEHDLLAAISTSFGAGAGAVLKSRHAYTHDARGLRTGAVQSGEFFADYGGTGDATGATTLRYTYNMRGELIEAVQHMGDVSAPDAPDSPLPGRHWTYAYDSVGNRTVAGGEAYTANALNQTNSREHNKRHLSGTGVPGMKVLALGPANAVTAPADYQGRFWSTEILLNNENAPAKAAVSLYFGKTGTGGATGTLLKRDPETDPGLALFMPKSPEQFIYDADGNLTADGKWSYTYDALNQLVAMETLAVTGNNVRAALLLITQGEQPKRLEFAYDYLGRRVEKKVYDYDPAAAGTAAQWELQTTTRYLYQGWNLIAEFTTGSAGFQPAGSGGTGDPPEGLDSPARTYHWGMDTAGTLTQTGGVGALLMIQDGGSQYFPAYDGNGNVTGLITAGGWTAAVYEYSPYGELLRCQGGYAKANPFRFSTKYWDEETGLIYYGLRYYSPTMGKFINRDPIGESGGLNLYGFVRNNPVNLVDVLGLDYVIQHCEWVEVDDPEYGPIIDYQCEDIVVMDPFGVTSDRYDPFPSLIMDTGPFEIDIPDLGMPIFPKNVANALNTNYLSNRNPCEEAKRKARNLDQKIKDIDTLISGATAKEFEMIMARYRMDDEFAKEFGSAAFGFLRIPGDVGEAGEMANLTKTLALDMPLGIVGSIEEPSALGIIGNAASLADASQTVLKYNTRAGIPSGFKYAGPVSDAISAIDIASKWLMYFGNWHDAKTNESRAMMQRKSLENDKARATHAYNTALENLIIACS